MSQVFASSSITVLATGVSITTGAASASSALPTMLSGERPRYIRVSGINACYARLGTSGVVATSTDTLIQPADAVIMAVPSGVTHIAAIQDSAAGKLNVVPLENM
jgi:hypothetical protein